MAGGGGDGGGGGVFSPISQCCPVYPGGHLHSYLFSRS